VDNQNLFNSKDINYEKWSNGASWNPGGLKFNTNLKALHFNNDKVYGFYDLGHGTVTNTGVSYLAQSWTGTGFSISAFAWHDCGTASVAAAVTDIAIAHPASGVSARINATTTSPVTAQVQSVATMTLTGNVAITEWGLFSASNTNPSATAGTLWDHKVFGAINAVSGDSIQFTYNLSISSGG